jgi:glycosyltransferase involved in cell wall biosynthesis
VSLWSKNQFEELSGKKVSTHIISPYVRLVPEKFEFIRKDDNVLKLLSVAMLSDRKNIHNVITALSHVKIPFKYDIVGKAGTDLYLSQLKELVNKYKLNDSITFHGRVSEEELIKKYQNASVFILVSYAEGYGMAYTDAMAYGLPIVASNRAAIPELIAHEQNGLLCEPDDTIAIAKAIERLGTDLDFSALIGKRNREKFATLSSRSDFVELSRIYFNKLKTELL